MEENISCIENYVETPFVVFPHNWKIKFRQGNKPWVIRFVVKTDDAPNEVSVVVANDKPYWEICPINPEGSDITSYEENYAKDVPLEDVDILIDKIKEALHYKK